MHCVLNLQINNDNYKSFLEGWKDNRVQMIFFGDRTSPTLRYMMAAFMHRERVSAGYVNLLK